MSESATVPRSDRSLLVVAGDEDVRSALVRGLRLQSFEVDVANNENEALCRAPARLPSAAIIDIGGPGLSGLGVVKGLRDLDRDLPICVLGTSSFADDGVASLDAGADDYLDKPFALASLVTRIEALMRVAGTALPSPFRSISVGPLYIDIVSRNVQIGCLDVQLTTREFTVLAVLAQHLGSVVSREQLLKLAWGYRFNTDTRVVDIVIDSLRYKLESTGGARLLHTIHGSGFTLRG